MSRNIFISYRRSDTRSDARQIYGVLRTAGGTGNVVLDVVWLRTGQRFDRALEKALAECDALLAVIGPRWLETLLERHESGERDFVRDEIETAMRRNVPKVVPVLVDGAKLPSASDVPESLQQFVKDLSAHQAREIRHEYFEEDCGALCRAIGLTPPEIKRQYRKLFLRGMAAATAILLGGGIYFSGVPVQVILGKLFAALPGEQTAPLTPVLPPQAVAFCDKCPEMVSIPAGEFSIGTSPGLISRAGSWVGFGKPAIPENEMAPGKRIKLSAFKIAGTEVTFEQWQACAAGGGCASNPKPHDEGWGRGDRPVINVSWHDALEYVRWLRTATRDDTWRLPSEAQWEYAARAGRSSRYAFGHEITRGEAQFDSSSTVRVRQTKQNGFALFEMNGNVSEWVQDCYHPDHGKKPEFGGAFEVNDCKVHVVRGGSWADKADRLRSAARDRKPPNTRDNKTGFRVVRD